MNSTNTWKKEFDTQFVKDEGDKMEDTWLDAVGCVGPVKYFIQETINSLLDELKIEEFGVESGNYFGEREDWNATAKKFNSKLERFRDGTK